MSVPAIRPPRIPSTSFFLPVVGPDGRFGGVDDRRTAGRRYLRSWLRSGPIGLRELAARCCDVRGESHDRRDRLRGATMLGEICGLRVARRGDGLPAPFAPGSGRTLRGLIVLREIVRGFLLQHRHQGLERAFGDGRSRPGVADLEDLGTRHRGDDVLRRPGQRRRVGYRASSASELAEQRGRPSQRRGPRPGRSQHRLMSDRWSKVSVESNSVRTVCSCCEGGVNDGFRSWIDEVDEAGLSTHRLTVDSYDFGAPKHEQRRPGSRSRSAGSGARDGAGRSRRYADDFFTRPAPVSKCRVVSSVHCLQPASCFGLFRPPRAKTQARPSPRTGTLGRSWLPVCAL